MSDTPDEDDKRIMHSLAGVKRLQSDKFDLYQQRPRKKHSVKIQADNDHELTFLAVSHNIPVNTPEAWFHHGIQKKLRRKIKSGQLTIDAMLDLHGHRQHEAIKELEAFFKYALFYNARMLLIVHGKGFNSQSEAVLRPLVQHWLSEQDRILAFCPAQPKDGGTGASYVYLKP